MNAWNDDEDDDLQRLLEGRDYDDEEQYIEEFVTFKQSIESKTKQKNVHNVVTEETPAESDGDSEDEVEFDENSRKAADDEAIEVPVTKTKSTKRRIVRNPRPKLDVNKLKSERGIVALPKYFDSVKFKGKYHEKDGLNRLMFGMEHWANRLMPSLSFDDFIEKCEALGHKRPIQTFMTKLRLDLPLDTIVENNRIGDEEEFQDFIEDTQPERIDPEAAFDKILEDDLLKEKIAIQQISQKESESNVNKQTLTEQQLKLIEEKRLKAIELRQKRLQKFDPNNASIGNSNTDSLVMTSTPNGDTSFDSHNDQ